MLRLERRQRRNFKKNRNNIANTHNRIRKRKHPNQLGMQSRSLLQRPKLQIQPRSRTRRLHSRPSRARWLLKAPLPSNPLKLPKPENVKNRIRYPKSQSYRHHSRRRVPVILKLCDMHGFVICQKTF